MLLCSDLGVPKLYSMFPGSRDLLNGCQVVARVFWMVTRLLFLINDGSFMYEVLIRTADSKPGC